MEKLDLNDKFLVALKEKFPRQATLTSVVEDILKIERESAYRRVRGGVKFSTREIGILAKHLNISLDNLLVDEQINVVHLNVISPRVEASLEKKIKKIEEYLKTVQSVSDIPDTEVGAVYTHLPMEFYIPYENLFKFIYYRWLSYYVGSEKCRNFSNWKIPDNIHKYHAGVMDAFEKLDKVLYIWDKNVIGDLVNDLKFFASASVLEKEDVEIIKREIHLMLNDLERLVAAGGPKNNPDNWEFYISNIKIGLTYVYAWSERYKFSYILNLTVISTVNEDPSTCDNIRNWIKSLKKISTLISGTGEKERLLFFKEQHQIVDSV